MAPVKPKSGTLPRGDMDSAQRKAVKRVWGDAPVIDARKELRVMILPDDLEGAKRQDPGCCVFARACKRAFNSTKVLFFRTLAYVELPDSKGNIRVERFVLSKEMRRLIEDFDKGSEVIPKAGFVLKPPGARGLDALAAGHRKRRAASPELRKREAVERRKRARIHGTRVDKSDDSARTVGGLVRSGTGEVHFTRTKPEGGAA